MRCFSTDWTLYQTLLTSVVVVFVVVVAAVVVAVVIAIVVVVVVVVVVVSVVAIKAVLSIPRGLRQKFSPQYHVGELRLGKLSRES